MRLLAEVVCGVWAVSIVWLLLMGLQFLLEEWLDAAERRMNEDG